MRILQPLLLVGAGIALTVTPAAGQEAAKPVPGCAGLAFTDPAGDQVFAVPGAGGAGEGSPNTDIIAGWFTTEDDGVFANLQVSNLDEAVTSPSTATGWYFVWTLADATKFVKAETSGSGFSYSFGTLDAGFQEEGDTQGKAFPGDKGVLRIKIPSAAGGAEGKKLTSPYGHTTNSYSVPGVGGALGTADDAPDAQNGKQFTVGGCSDGTASPTPTPAPGATPAPAPAPAAKPTFDVRVSPRVASAKKVAKSRKLALGLKAKTPLTSVVVKLQTSKGATIATGRLAKLGSSAKLTLKLKRAPKAGAYKLRITGRTASGAAVSGSLGFRLKK